MQKILCVIGTRPEIIKMAPVIRELKQHPDDFQPITCNTGQHREMADQLLGLFQITPDYNLDVMKPNQTLAGLTSMLFARLDGVIREVRPDWVLAQGDTTTVFAAAMTSYYHRACFGHVEAGLRTRDKFQPFPEELNRVVADHAADLLFAPTEESRHNLMLEGLPKDRIIVTGNTVVDALHMSIALRYDWKNGPLARLDLTRQIVLVTTHRRESFGEPLQAVLNSVKSLAQEFPTTQFVFPVHPNPNVNAPVHNTLSNISNILLLEPLDYLSLVNVMQLASLIITDSGGIQEEGASLGIPVLVLRETTERPEGLATGLVELVGTTPNLLLSKARHRLQTARSSNTRFASPYGDGNAARRIVEAIRNHRRD